MKKIEDIIGLRFIKDSNLEDGFYLKCNYCKKIKKLRGDINRNFSYPRSYITNYGFGKCISCNNEFNDIVFAVKSNCIYYLIIKKKVFPNGSSETNHIDYDLVSNIQDENTNTETNEYYEGEEAFTIHKEIERNRSAREKCIELNGVVCMVCGFDFGKIYGEFGEGFIEIHHIIPLSKIRKEYSVNPQFDLVPVCSNCHSIIHRNNISIETLRNKIKSNT